MANRDQPVNGRPSKLFLLKAGNLILTDSGKFTVWATNTQSLSSNMKGITLSESFDFPTNTLLPQQLLTRSTRLVSSRSQTNYSSGFYKLFFDNDNLLHLLYDGLEVSSIYWPDVFLLSWKAGRSTYNNSWIAVLDTFGNFNSSDNFTFLAANYGAKLHRRLKIDYDGDVRLYSCDTEGEMWFVSWQAIQKTCKIYGICGANSLCSYTVGSGRKCPCLPGYKMKNLTDWSDRCELEFDLSCNRNEFGFLSLPQVEFFGYDYLQFISSNYFCEHVCWVLCSSKLLKYQLSTIEKRSDKMKRFTYAELKKATKDFNEEIRRGAGGIVYKGVLLDNRAVAIKRLNEPNQGEGEFLVEVSIIRRIIHMNLIQMWGYCTEGKCRLLVYEYMEHGSLAQNLSHALDWKKRFDIATGTANGLAYLHEECLEWVLHCDVKPQNILLDSNYQPKVAVFGLSKLQNRNFENASFSRIRRTRGYMAPEWIFNLPITSKVDVYSYGIVVLEMVTGKGPTKGVHAIDRGGETEPKRLVAWVRENKNEAVAMTSWLEKIVDPLLEGNYEKDKMEILVTVALQCVEEEKDARPNMSHVAEMLLRQENDSHSDDHDVNL
ncbi:hypothetical protein I3760_15G049500 [Carya illinoinensis]|nr:hypothetical protein I3760_15G049500 [Carya illinoinensis]